MTKKTFLNLCRKEGCKERPWAFGNGRCIQRLEQCQATCSYTELTPEQIEEEHQKDKRYGMIIVTYFKDDKET